MQRRLWFAVIVAELIEGSMRVDPFALPAATACGQFIAAGQKPASIYFVQDSFTEATRQAVSNNHLARYETKLRLQIHVFPARRSTSYRSHKAPLPSLRYLNRQSTRHFDYQTKSWSDDDPA
ncbi:hypothetical protein [Noviherbaspirillum sp.]|uniref:hypothetical protein n=1 Tax=Noviherbaspirillum sp. TaxID=1926288 RepID=UPI002FE3A1C7